MVVIMTVIVMMVIMIVIVIVVMRMRLVVVMMMEMSTSRMIPVKMRMFWREITRASTFDIFSGLRPRSHHGI
jgi:hypothetical protein